MLEDEDLLRLCYAVSWKSEDPSTKIGALVTHRGQVISIGHNYLLPGCKNLPDDKLFYTQHAETAAIWDALSRRDKGLHGCQLYASAAACSSCAKAIIGAGIQTVITHNAFQKASKRWGPEILKAQDMMRAFGITVEVWEGELNCLAFFEGSKIHV